MPKSKQEIGLSFKVSQAMKVKLDQECEKEHRALAEMAKLLIAEALCYREAKNNTHRIL